MPKSSRRVLRHVAASAYLSTLASAWSWDKYTTLGQAPLPRYGNSLIFWSPNEEDPQAISCGGSLLLNGSLQADCHILQPNQDWTWQRLTKEYYVRSHHTAVIRGDFLLLYGGNTSDNDPSRPEVFKVGIWDHTPATFTGTIPAARMLHSGAVHVRTDSWIIFGGMTLDDTPVILGDVVALNLGNGLLPEYTWYRLNVSVGGAVPAPRHCHAAAMAGDTMIVVGGLGMKNVVLDDVWTLTYTPDSGMWAWTSHSDSSCGPRYGHSLIIAGGYYLIMYGGSDVASGAPGGAHAPSGGIRVLDGIGDSISTTWRWRTPTVSGEWLRAPLWAGMALVGTDSVTLSQQLVVFGGLPDPQSDPVDPVVYTGLVGVLTGIGLDGAPGEVELAALLGAGASALFLLVILSFFVWRYRRAKLQQQQLGEGGGGMEMNTLLGAGAPLSAAQQAGRASMLQGLFSGGGRQYQAAVVDDGGGWSLGVALPGAVGSVATTADGGGSSGGGGGGSLRRIGPVYGATVLPHRGSRGGTTASTNNRDGAGTPTATARPTLIVSAGGGKRVGGAAASPSETSSNSSSSTGSPRLPQAGAAGAGAAAVVPGTIAARAIGRSAKAHHAPAAAATHAGQRRATRVSMASSVGGGGGDEYDSDDASSGGSADNQASRLNY